MRFNKSVFLDLRYIRINCAVENFSASDLLTAMAGRGWQISCEEQDTHEFFHAIITTLSEEHYHSRCSYGIMDLSFTKGRSFLVSN